MRRVTWLVGLVGSGVLALGGAVNGCSSSSEHPPVLDGTGTDSGRSSSSSGGITGGSSGSGSSSGGPMCTVVDGGCTNLPLCGAQVNVIGMMGTTPLPKGGTIVPGTYALTKVDYYGSGTGWVNQTIRLTGAGGGDGGAAEGGNDAAMAEAGGDDGSASEAGSEGGSEGGGDMGPDATVDAGAPAQSFTFESIVITDSTPLATVSGTLSSLNSTSINIALTCGSSTTTPWGYTSSSTSIALIAPPQVLTFTKQ